MGSFTSDVASVGPESVDAAGELAPNVTKHHQGQELIDAVRAAHPVELVAIQSRDEDRPRTAALVASEVEASAIESFGDGEDPNGIAKVLSARVRGRALPTAEKMVVVLFETASGRTGRCAIPYAPLRKSAIAFDQKVEAGEITDVDETDAKDLTRAVERQEDTIRRLRAELEASKTAPPADDGEGEETPEEPSVPEEPTEVELPEGVEAGDPGYPVDEETGELLALPDSVRESLITSAQAVADAEAAVEAAKAEAAAPAAEPEAPAAEEPAAAAEPEPEPVAAPEGAAKDLIKNMGDYSAPQLEALIAGDTRPSVVKAAKAAKKRLDNGG